MVRFIELSLLFHKSLRIPSLSFLFLPSLSLWLFNFSFVFGFDFFLPPWLSVFSLPTMFLSVSTSPRPQRTFRMIYGTSAASHFAFDLLCVHISEPRRHNETNFPSELFYVKFLPLHDLINFTSRELFLENTPTKPIVYGFYHRWMAKFPSLVLHRCLGFCERSQGC